MARRKPNDSILPPALGLSVDEARSRLSDCYDTLQAKIMAGYGPERGRVEIQTWREFAEAYAREYPEIWAEVTARKKNESCPS